MGGIVPLLPNLRAAGLRNQNDQQDNTIWFLDVPVRASSNDFIPDMEFLPLRTELCCNQGFKSARFTENGLVLS